MDIFRYRPLFLWCAGFMGAAAGGFFLFSQARLPYISTGSVLALALALIIAVGGITVGVLFGKRKGRSAVTILVVTLLAGAALLQSYATFSGPQASFLSGYEHKTTSVRATVIERRGEGGYLSGFAVELVSVDGQVVDGNALLTCHYPADLSPGQTAEMMVMLIPLAEAAGDGYDAATLIGDGYIVGLLSESESEITVLDESVPTEAVIAGRIRRTWAARLNLLTQDAHGLPSALLLGDKSALEDSVRRDFARSGVSHLLAISGLHMTLLFGLLEGMLRLVRVPKRIRALMLVATASGYLILLGFPPSATRAMVMLGMVYLSTLMAARADPLTSLGLAGALIMALSPYTVADAGFWMSFFATLGLITCSPWLHNRSQSSTTCSPLRCRLKTAFRNMLFGLLVGILAMSFTLFLTAAVIGEMGILSPISTLILTPLCGAILLLSLAALPLFGTAAGEAVGGLIEWLSQGMVTVAEEIAEPSWTVVSLTHPAIVPVAIAGLALILLLMAIRLPVRKRWIVLLPILLTWVAIGGILLANELATDGEINGTYLQPSSQADALVLVEGHEAVICDLSNGSLTALNASALEASRQGATEIAVLMLTHYHGRTAGSLSDFFGRETVRALWLPYPTDTEDYHNLLAYLEKADAAAVPVTLYRPGESLTVFGESTVTLYTSDIRRSVQPVLLLALDTAPQVPGAGETVYCGSAVFESELADRAATMMEQADTIIFGNHGPLPKAVFGGTLRFRENSLVVLSAQGDIAGYFDPSALPPGTRLWWGQRRFEAS